MTRWWVGPHGSAFPWGSVGTFTTRTVTKSPLIELKPTLPELNFGPHTSVYWTPVWKGDERSTHRFVQRRGVKGVDTFLSMYEHMYCMYARPTNTMTLVVTGLVELLRDLGVDASVRPSQT